jgi:hypothetical protein
MFTMMNNARLNVGVQGLAIAERAYQQARDFARIRVQGRPAGAARDRTEDLPIICHPDVRRMLLWMRAATEAMRGFTYYAAMMIDRSRRLSDAKERWRAQRRAELLIPVVKAWCSDLGVAVASTGIQVHGGMGYIEETGAAQYLRDARIAPIYEGTNGIQAHDLVDRKLSRDRGEALAALLDDMEVTLTGLGRLGGSDFRAIAGGLQGGILALRTATTSLLKQEAASAAAASAPFLTMLGIVCAGWLMAQQALAADRRSTAEGGDPAFVSAKIQTARFYAEHFLPVAEAHLQGVLNGAALLDFDLDQF